MQRTTVYYFIFWDETQERYVRSERPATLEAIEELDGTPIQSDSKVVDASLLDEHGVLRE